MNKINAFLDQICLHISCKAVHSEVRQELSEHIDELNREERKIAQESEEE